MTGLTPELPTPQCEPLCSPGRDGKCARLLVRSRRLAAPPPQSSVLSKGAPPSTSAVTTFSPAIGAIEAITLAIKHRRGRGFGQTTTTSS